MKDFTVVVQFEKVYRISAKDSAEAEDTAFEKAVDEMPDGFEITGNDPAEEEVTPCRKK